MNRRSAYAIAVVLVIIAAAAIVVELDHPPGHQDTGSSSNSFFQEPVVDIIIPQLFSNNANSPLNLTKGTGASLVVEIFPTVNLNVSIGAEVNSLSNPSENISGLISLTFAPPSLSIEAQSSANTTLVITTSTGVQLGEYSVTVSATNMGNYSQYWGTIFQLNIVG